MPLTAKFRAFLESGALDLSAETGPFILHPAVKQGSSCYRYDFRRPYGDHLKRCGVVGVISNRI